MDIENAASFGPGQKSVEHLADTVGCFRGQVV
jgi:hypothetical protein